MSLPITLIPCIPESSSRYLPPTKRVVPRERVVLPAMFSSTSELPPTYETDNWSKSVHPEGAVYFHMTHPKSDDGPGIDIVTDDDAQDPSVASHLTKCVQTIMVLIRDHKRFLTRHQRLELYLKTEDGDLCSYYFVERRAKTIFFLEEYSSDDLGLELTVSEGHLRQSLERQFWIHTEFFPNHFGGLLKRELDDLMGQFRHGNTDQITSGSSTFPYELEKCRDILPVLESIRQHHLHAKNIDSGYDVAIIARFASILTNTRIQIHYGEMICRLDRHTPILVSEEVELQWTKSVISVVTLGFADMHLKRLNDLYVDTYVYNQLWAKRMRECIREWTNTGMAAVVLLFLHAFSFLLDVNSALAQTSASFAAISLLSSVLLVIRHEPLETSYDGNGYNHLSSIRSDLLGFQGAAFGFAIPKATLVIGLFTFLSQGLYLLLKDVPLIHRLPWITAICMLLWVFNLLTSPHHRILSLRWFNRSRVETSMA